MTRRLKNKPIREVYMKSSPENHETVFSGITFADFVEFIPIPVENIILLKSGYTSYMSIHNFELLEGKESINKLKLDDIYSYGDFSFVDYTDTSLPSQLTDSNVAELLYLSHMNKPLKSPFFEVLQNNFAYLSHDDGWWCKLYSKESEAPIALLLNKLRKIAQETVCSSALLLPKELSDTIYELSASGLVVEIDIMKRKKKDIKIRIYEVGAYEDMDVLFNSFDDEKPLPSYEVHLY